jgi:hypothetical protein
MSNVGENGNGNYPGVIIVHCIHVLNDYIVAIDR